MQYLSGYACSNGCPFPGGLQRLLKNAQEFSYVVVGALEEYYMCEVTLYDSISQGCISCFSDEVFAFTLCRFVAGIPLFLMFSMSFRVRSIIDE